MKGYFDNQEATAKAFTDDKYFRTGDVAVVHPDGALEIRDRAKDEINTGPILSKRSMMTYTTLTARHRWREGLKCRGRGCTCQAAGHSRVRSGRSSSREVGGDPSRFRNSQARDLGRADSKARSKPPGWLQGAIGDLLRARPAQDQHRQGAEERPSQTLSVNIIVT